MRTRGLAAGRRNAGTPGRAQGQRWIDSSILSTLYTKRRVFSAKHSVSIADYAGTCQQWRPRLISGDAGLHTRPQTTRWHLVRVANYRGRGAVCGIALIARRTVEEREKGWDVPRSQAPGRTAGLVLTLEEGDLHSRRQSLPACGASRPARLRHAKARLQSKFPKHAHAYQPLRLMITEDAVSAHGTLPSRKCDIDWP